MKLGSSSGFGLLIGIGDCGHGVIGDGGLPGLGFPDGGPAQEIRVEAGPVGGIEFYDDASAHAVLFFAFFNDEGGAEDGDIRLNEIFG